MIIEGIFGRAAAEICLREDKGQKVMDAAKIVDALKDVIDIDSIDKEALLDAYLLVVADLMLNNKGYKSVLPGKKLFLRVETCKNKVVLEKMLKHAQVDRDKMIQVVNRILSAADSNIEGQFVYDLDSGLVVESATDKDVERILRAEAVI